jgi:hypothetical protein
VVGRTGQARKSQWSSLRQVVRVLSPLACASIVLVDLITKDVSLAFEAGMYDDRQR